MRILYCIICSKYRMKIPKISYLLEIKFVLSVIRNKCKIVDEKVCKEEDSIQILKILDLNKNI